MFVLTLGLLISLGCYFIAFPSAQARRPAIFLPMMVLHIAAGVAFWIYAQSQASDANLYWNDPYGLADEAFAPGTAFTVQFLHWMRAWLGGDFLAHFIFFQSMGLIGLSLLLRSFTEVTESLGLDVPLLVYGILFLPGLHFWTAAIGKDAPLFMAVALTVWATIRIERRILWFGAGVLVMFLIRPHIGALACIALAATFLFNRRMPIAMKLLLAPIAFAGVVFVTAEAQQQLGLTSLDSTSLTNFVERTSGLSEQFGGGTNLAALPFPLKLLTLLFRPFFFDANGALGLIVSVENLLLVGIIGLIVVRAMTLIRLAPSVFYIPYCLFFSVALIVLLAMINYNVGLGLRQKMMAMPAILMLFATLVIYSRYQKLVAAQRAAALDPRMAAAE